jgi:DNA-binding LacI/PurR family transcriptional regulator
MTSKSKRQSGRATLQEVADLACVSASTVSLVLAGKAEHRRISEDTHARVRQAAEALNYAPNLLTRSLRQGRTNIFSFFSTFRNREEHDMYMDKMVSAVESAGGHAGYDVLVHCNFKRTPREIYQFLNGGIAEGLLLFAPSPEDPLLPLLRNSSLPVVIINGRDPHRHYPSVAEDTAQGMRLISEELIALGHHKIAMMVAEGTPSRDALRRMNMLRNFYREHGFTLSDEDIYPTPEDPTEVLRHLMSLPEPPTALFCWHDRMAYQVLAGCEQLGISVPQQLSVVGYDGIQWPSETSHVAASIKVDLNSLARRAVSILDQYITGQPEVLIEETQTVSFLRGTSLGVAPVRSTCATEQL